MDKASRHNRILDCRYYNGEDECPQGISEMFWFYESVWANGDSQTWEEEKYDFKRLGLSNFEENDGTPPELKYLLYNRYRHWNGIFSVDEFRDWYNTQYQQPRKTNRQRRTEVRKGNLIAQCRYYNGEESNPFENTPFQMIWYYESCWVEQLSESFENAEIYYWHVRQANLEQFAHKHKIPRSLLGLFLNRYEYWHSYDKLNVESFINWIVEVYIKNTPKK